METKSGAKQVKFAVSKEVKKLPDSLPHAQAQSSSPSHFDKENEMTEVSAMQTAEDEVDINSQLALEVASSPHPDNSIYRLSAAPELQCEILKFVRSTQDLKALALVSHEWHVLVLPELWKSLTTDLVPRGKQELADLVKPDSNILKYVQHLCFRHPEDKDEESGEDEQVPGPDLPLLLCAIPKNQLRGFESDISLPYLTFQILLQQHQNMQTLRVMTDGNDAHHLMTKMAQSPWALKCFSNLKHLTVYPAHEDAQGTRLLLDQCPQLESLTLSHPGDDSGLISISRDTFDEKDENDTRISKLRKWVAWSGAPKFRNVAVKKLVVDNVHLPQHLDGLFRRIDMLLLKELVFVRTESALHFIHELAQKFKGATPALKHFTLAEMDAEFSPTFNQDTSLFLNSFTGLVELRINGLDQHPIEPEAIVHHGSTLRILSLVMDDEFHLDRKHAYTAPQFARLTAGCPHLEQLRINLYELYQPLPPTNNAAATDSATFRPTPPFKMDEAPPEFLQVLASIASLRNLHTLHFPQHPLLTSLVSHLGTHSWLIKDGWAAMYMHSHATSLLQHLSSLGSNVKVLGFGPIACGSDVELMRDKDANGHRFPKYWYVKAQVKDVVKVGDGVVARPLADWKGPFPGSTVLKGI